MKDAPLPPRRYNTTDYPNVATASIGRPIPIGYGTLTNLTPVECDTAAHRYKILDQAVAEITQIRSGGSALVKNTGYQEYPTLAEFRLTFNAKLAVDTTYYFAIFGDWAIDGTHYIDLGANTGEYADGYAYTINGSSVWSVQTTSLRFKLYGKYTSDGVETTLAENLTDDSTAGIHLRMAATDTRVGQSFQVPTYPYYPTRLTIEGIVDGTAAPAGTSHLWVVFYSAISPEDICCAIGDVSHYTDIAAGSLDLLMTGWDTTPVVECDVKSPGTEMNQAGDILEDLIETVLDRADGLLDATELANLETDKTEVLKMYLDDETTFGDVVAKLEAGQTWKLVPKQDGTYMPIVYETGEPANTPHFFDHDFLSFSMELDNSEIRRTVNVNYDEDEETGDYLTRTASSNIAKFFYMEDRSLEVATFLTSGANADTLAAAYLARYEVPIITVVFTVHGWALDLLPGRDKVKITHTRAAYAGGTLAAVLFRIVKLVKNPATNTTEVTACVWGNSAT